MIALPAAVSETRASEDQEGRKDRISAESASQLLTINGEKVITTTDNPPGLNFQLWMASA